MESPFPGSWLWIVPLEIPGAAGRACGLLLLPVVTWGKQLCHLPPLAGLGAKGTCWNRLPEVIPIPGSAEDPIIYIFFWERLALAGFSSPFIPPHQERTAESPVPCPSTACSTSCHARAQIFAKIFLKCSLKPQHETKCLCFSLPSLPELPRPSCGVGGGGRKDELVFLLRKGPYPQKIPNIPSVPPWCW